MPLQGEFIVNNPTQSKGGPQPVNQPPQGQKALTPHEKRSTNPFTSFVELPKGITFENQEDQEEVVLLVRRDFITNSSWITIGILLVFLPFFLPFIPHEFFSLTIIPHGFFFFLGIFYYLLVFGYIFTQYTGWYFRAGIITNLRVIDIQINNLLSREVSELFLDSIRDVSYTQVGLFQTLFDFGTVYIKTDSQSSTLVYELVPRAKDIAYIITRLMETR